MTEDEKTRLLAWGNELRAVHQRLREALLVTATAAAGGDPVGPPGRNLLVFCRGFCTALTGHHRGEDSQLFPAIAVRHPELAETLRKLEADHSIIADLVDRLQAAAERAAPTEEFEQHLRGIAAIMESHFRYEERQLLGVLATLELDASPREALGPG